MKAYLSVSDKNQYLLNHIRMNKGYSYLEQVSEEIAEGQYKMTNVVDSYHDIPQIKINQDCNQMDDFGMDMLIEVNFVDIMILYIILNSSLILERMRLCST